jgi:hypothetical protein
MELTSLENMLEAALIDAKDCQAKESSKEMAMCITYIENAQDKVWRLKRESNE